MRPCILSLAFLGTLALSAGQHGAVPQGINLHTAAIEQATGLKGQLIAEENVFKVSKPRTDVKIAVDQWSMPPFMGLGSWAAFTPAHGGAMLMGDTVVFEDEVNPAMSAAFDAGLEVTALHNHAQLMGVAMASPLSAETATFETDAVGGPPRGWLLTMTGRGAPKWTVERDEGAAVLKQSGKATYPVALKEGTNIRDGFAEVKFKPISGSEDRAGGIVWRAKDANNYYVVRANALEDNVVLYKTVNGVRSSLDLVGQKGGYGVRTAVPAHQWHTLRVEFVGIRFNVVFNGKPLFTVEDATFAEAGMVGLWTKADSVTLFSGFTYGERR